jgi:hypothetical protein
MKRIPVRPKSLTLSTSEGKTYEQMTKHEKDILAQTLKWKGKALRDLSRGELIDCIVHTTQQVVLLQYDLEKVYAQRGPRAAFQRVYNWVRKQGKALLKFIKPTKPEETHGPVS